MKTELDDASMARTESNPRLGLQGLGLFRPKDAQSGFKESGGQVTTMNSYSTFTLL